MRFYVYELVDPRTNAVFYIGKGQHTRLTNHLRPHIYTKKGRKNEIIREIFAAGLEPIARKVQSFRTDIESRDFEKRLILKWKDQLSNKLIPKHADYLFTDDKVTSFDSIRSAT